MFRRANHLFKRETVNGVGFSPVGESEKESRQSKTDPLRQSGPAQIAPRAVDVFSCRVGFSEEGSSGVAASACHAAQQRHIVALFAECVIARNHRPWVFADSALEKCGQPAILQN